MKHRHIKEMADTHLPHLSEEEKEKWVEHYVSTHPGFHTHGIPPEKPHPSVVEVHKAYNSHSLWISIAALVIVILTLFFLLARGAKAEPYHVIFNKTTSNGSYHFNVEASYQDIQQIFSFDASSNLKVNCITGCSSTPGFTDAGAFTVGSTTIAIIGAYFTSGADPTCNTGSGCRLRADASSNLKVNCAVGCSGSSFSDRGTFTFGTTPISLNGGVFDDTPPADLTTGLAGAFRVTPKRGVHTNLRNQAGVEIGTSGTPIRIDPTGSTTQPVSGTVTTSPPANASANMAQWASQTLGAMANYGTSPGAVLVPGVNAFITNIPHVIVDTAPTTAVTLPAGQAVELLDSGGVNKASISAAGAVKVDGSAVTQPVSGTVTTTPPSNASTNVAQWASSNLGAMANYGTSPGAVLVPGVNSFITNIPAVTQSGTWTTRIVGNAGVSLDAATGAAPPANTLLDAGLGSGATGGLLIGKPVADTYKPVNISTATTTLLITGVAGRQVRISSINLINAAADNVALIEGTGATCGTGSAGLTGGTTAASGWNLPAGGGMAFGTGVGTVIQTVTTGDSVCAVTSATTQLSGGLMYAIY